MGTLAYMAPEQRNSAKNLTALPSLSKEHFIAGIQTP